VLFLTLACILLYAFRSQSHDSLLPYRQSRAGDRLVNPSPRTRPSAFSSRSISDASHTFPTRCSRDGAPARNPARTSAAASQRTPNVADERPYRHVADGPRPVWPTGQLIYLPDGSDSRAPAPHEFVVYKTNPRAFRRRRPLSFRRFFARRAADQSRYHVHTTRRPSTTYRVRYRNARQSVRTRKHIQDGH